MEEPDKEEKKTVRTILAPDAHLSAKGTPSTRVLSVDLAEGEEVEWIWSIGPEGRSFVSGYQIIEDD